MWIRWVLLILLFLFLVSLGLSAFWSSSPLSWLRVVSSSILVQLNSPKLSNLTVSISQALYHAVPYKYTHALQVNGEDWSRHRKLTAPCFNERVSGFVWDEALRQARSMLSHWLSQPNGKISNMVDDTRVIALHVLTAAGFGISHDFLGGARNPAPGHKLSHRDALMTILDNLITSIILSNTKWLERYRIVLPQRVQHIFLALREFSQYMDEMLASERKILADSQGASKPNLITTLIRTSDDAQTEGIKSAVRLTDDEIKGNIFIFNLAGHDTTANTLAYAFALLAVYPEYQTWVAEEIDEVLGDQENPKYDEAFPKLKRVMAVMVSFHPPIPPSSTGLAILSTCSFPPSSTLH